VHAAGRFNLPVWATGRAKRKLDRLGVVKLRVKASFTPTGGERRTRVRVVKLSKRVS
jgi:hypothetical protein